MPEYTDCVNQKIKGGAVSICPTCIHHNICKVINNQPCIECSQFICAADAIKSLETEVKRWKEEAKDWYLAYMDLLPDSQEKEE